MNNSDFFSKEDIKKQLSSLGVPQDRPVTVHSSLRAVGKTENRGEGFLEALIEYVTAKGGLLCIPTHTWHRCNDNYDVTLDISSSDVCIGTLSKIASVFPGVHRSENPTHSLAVFGDEKKAEEFILHDRSLYSSSDPSGCLGQLECEDGSILLIGVGQDKNTYIHTLEDTFGIQNRLSDFIYPALVRKANGEIEERPLRLIAPKDIGDVSQRYPKFEPAFCAAGAVTFGYVGSAFTRLCSARKMKRAFAAIVEKSGGAELLANDEPLPVSFYLD